MIGGACRKNRGEGKTFGDVPYKCCLEKRVGFLKEGEIRGDNWSERSPMTAVGHVQGKNARGGEQEWWAEERTQE